MKVILDWVPNHTGWDHAWIKTNPEYYQQNDRGEIIDPLDGYGNSCGWEDTAGLNYANPSLRAAMIEELLFWIREYKIDGYRMDIAFLVPHYFWLEAKEALVAAKSDIFMLAEADRPEHLNEGAFHACYGWSFHYIMNCIARGEKNVYDIEHWVWNEKSKMQQGSFMHFTSNHDENTWHGDEYERMGEAAAKSFAVLTMLWDGIPLIYSGQEEPLKKRLEFFEKDNIGFDKFELQDFYAKLVHLKNKRPCLWNLPYGAHAHMISHHSHVYAFRRQVGNDRIAVVLNLSMETQSAVLDENISGYDLFTNKYYTFPQGSELILEPWQYLILT
jgi:glycosidase